MTITHETIESWASIQSLEVIANKMSAHFTPELYVKDPKIFDELAELLLLRVFCVDEDGRSLISYNELSTAARALLHIGEVSNYESRVFLEQIDYFPRTPTELFKTKQAQNNKEVRSLLFEHMPNTYLLHEIGYGETGMLAQACTFEEMLGQVPRITEALHTDNKYILVDAVNSMCSSISNYFKTHELTVDIAEQLSFILTLKDIKFGSGVAHTKIANQAMSIYEYTRIYEMCASVLGHEHLNTHLETTALLGIQPNYACWKHGISKQTTDEIFNLPCEL